MADITSDVEITDNLPNLGVRSVLIETPSTADDTDTLDLTLSDYSIDEVVGVLGFNSSSNVAEDPASASVSGGVLTITVGGANDNEKRSYIVYGR